MQRSKESRLSLALLLPIVIRKRTEMDTDGSRGAGWGWNALIRVGFELSQKGLHGDILAHPARYFFILVANGQAFLCIRTCDQQGEDITAHIIEGLVADEEGDLSSIFDHGLREAVLEQREQNGHSCKGGEYPISPQLGWIISMMPDMIEWLISSVLTNGRSIVLCPLSHSSTPF
jgi:hypothetical protein